MKFKKGGLFMLKGCNWCERSTCNWFKGCASEQEADKTEGKIFKCNTSVIKKD